MGTEQERIENIIKDMAEGKNVDRKLGYDRERKRIVPISKTYDPDSAINITPEDAILFSNEAQDIGMIVVSQNAVHRQSNHPKLKKVFFVCQANENVYRLIENEQSEQKLSGTLCFANKSNNISITDFGDKEDHIRLVVQLDNDANISQNKSPEITGYLLHKGKWIVCPVQVLPSRDQIFSRINGLIETDVLSNKTVAVFGLGSGGSQITLELVKSGVGKIIGVDPDRLEIGNIARHIAGLPDVGRYKTNAVADILKKKIPMWTFRCLKKKYPGKISIQSGIS